MRWASAKSRRLQAWQAFTVALLFAGYSGYYLCRSHLSVVAPLLQADLAAHGLSAFDARVRIGQMVSWGVLAYAAGKLLLTGAADLFGGKKNFVGGMAGAVAFTFLFAAGSGTPWLTTMWIGNRFVQSAGWAGLVKIASRWFGYSAYGTVMAILSLSFLFGDALARQYMAALIHDGVGWRGVFWIAGATLLPILLLNVLWLRESRTQIGATEPETNPANLFAAGSDRPQAARAGRLLRPFLTSPAFGLICLVSLVATLVRETFNFWTPTYFHEVAGFSESDAAGWSSIFPFLGGVSVLLAGIASDRMGPRARNGILTGGLAIAALALAGMALPQRSPWMSIVLVGGVALGLLGPYSYLAGAIALDFGGKHGGAMASGLIDAAGYAGAILAGDSVARISSRYGWGAAFAILSALTMVGAAAAGMLLLRGRR